MIAIAGGIIVIVASILFYLASPHQQVLARSGGSKPLAAAGTGGLPLGLILILLWAGPGTSVFIALTLAMLVWSFLPVVAAWWRSASESKK